MNDATAKRLRTLDPDHLAAIRVILDRPITEIHPEVHSAARALFDRIPPRAYDPEFSEMLRDLIARVSRVADVIPKTHPAFDLASREFDPEFCDVLRSVTERARAVLGAEDGRFLPAAFTRAFEPDPIAQLFADSEPLPLR